MSEKFVPLSEGQTRKYLNKPVMNKKFIVQFQKAYKREYGHSLSYNKAFEKFIDLTNLIKLLLADTGEAQGDGYGEEKSLQVKVQN
jgi:hypothetical protein